PTSAMLTRRSPLARQSRRSASRLCTAAGLTSGGGGMPAGPRGGVRSGCPKAIAAAASETTLAARADLWRMFGLIPTSISWRQNPPPEGRPALQNITGRAAYKCASELLSAEGGLETGRKPTLDPFPRTPAAA